MIIIASNGSFGMLVIHHLGRRRCLPVGPFSGDVIAMGMGCFYFWVGVSVGGRWLAVRGVLG